MAKWPTLLITGGRDFTLLSSDGTSKTLDTGLGLYYGLSWDKNNIYLAHRKASKTSDLPAVSVLDKNFKRVGQLEGDFSDIHQIYHDGSKLYTTVTKYDSIGVWDGKKYELVNWTGKREDSCHMNSIWCDSEGNKWICYHNFTKKFGRLSSRVVMRSPDLSTELASYDLGKDIHSCFVLDGNLYVGNSGLGELLVYDLETSEVKGIQLGDWTRGLAVNEEVIVVGASKFSEKRERLLGDARIFLLDRKSLEVLDERVVERAGAVLDLRIADGIDYAHNGITFPGII